MTDRIPVRLAQDCSDVVVFASLEALHRYMGPIDVENDEYGAWDANGQLLKLASGSRGRRWLRWSRRGR